MNLTNENRLIITCARTRIAGSQLDELKYLVSRPLDWDRIVESALSQGIAPFLYHNLKNIPETHGIPKGVMAELKKNYHENIARNMYLYAELARIVKAFHDKGINTIVLKGAALAKFVYRDIGLRSMIDIDLLVKQEDLLHARDIVSDLNYVPEVRRSSEEWYRKNHHHLPVYINREKSILIELHWNIADNCGGMNTDAWWKRAGNVQIDGQDVLMPAPEDILMHLCLHLFNHGYPPEMMLRAMCDISATLDRYQGEIDWEAFQNEIDAYKLHTSVLTILYLVKKLHDRNEKSLRNIQPSQISVRLLKILETRISVEDDICSSIPSGFMKVLSTDIFRRKVTILLSVLFPPWEDLSKTYCISSVPKKLFFYFLRPVSLCLRYGKYALAMYKIKNNK